jgi:hypothetical protein
VVRYEDVRRDVSVLIVVRYEDVRRDVSVLIVVRYEDVRRDVREKEEYGRKLTTSKCKVK